MITLISIITIIAILIIIEINVAIDKFFFIKYMKDFDVVSYIDNLIITYSSVYLMSRNISKIRDEEIPEVISIIVNDYISIISDNIIALLKYNVRKSKIDRLISDRINYIVYKVINEYNQTIDNRGE